MDCDKTIKISQMIDGELSAEELKQLRSHLATCMECQSIQEDFLLFREQIKNFSQIQAEELNQRATQSLWQRFFHQRFEFSFSAPAFALILLVLITGGIWLTFRKSESETVATNNSNKTVLREEKLAQEKLEEPSLARFDYGGRAEVYTVRKIPAGN